MSYIDDLYEKLLHTLDMRQAPVMNKKDSRYGECLAEMTNTLWIEEQAGDGVKAAAYVSFIELEDDTIRIHYTYWTKYAALKVTKPNDNAVTEWNRRCTSSGLVIVVEISTNDDMYNPEVTIRMHDRGWEATFQLRTREEELLYIDHDNEEKVYRAWVDTNCLLNCNSDASDMKKRALRALINWVIRTVRHGYYDASGYGEEFVDYEDDGNYINNRAMEG